MSLPTEFLIFSLFFPRLSLLFLWLQSLVPMNPTPFWLDFALTAIVPRVMVLWLIYGVYGMENAWFIVHAVVAVLVYGVAILNSGSDD